MAKKFSERRISSPVAELVSNQKSNIKLTMRYPAEIECQFSAMNHAPDNKADVQAAISTIESQINSPKPKAAIIQEALQSIRRVLEGGLVIFCLHSLY